MNETPAQPRKDIPPLDWSADFLTARPHEDLGLPGYQIHRAFGGYRVSRGNTRSKRLKNHDACHRAIISDYTANFIRAFNAPGSRWLPMELAPVTGWAILARLRGDLAALLEDHRYNAWAQKQIVVRCTRLNDDPVEGTWDMCAPSGSDAIPSGWFTGWRPLVSPLPYGAEDMPLMIAAE